MLIYNQANQLDRAIKAAGLMASAYNATRVLRWRIPPWISLADFEGARISARDFFFSGPS